MKNPIVSSDKNYENIDTLNSRFVGGYKSTHQPKPTILMFVSTSFGTFWYEFLNYFDYLFLVKSIL